MCEFTNQIVKIDGKGTFLEVTSDMMPMGKIQFNFCTYDNNNAMTCALPFYLGETESIALATELVSGNLKNRKAGQNTYFEKSGGSNNIAALKKWCPWLKDGMHVARRFKVEASTKYEYLFKVEYGVGHKDGNLSVMDKVEKYIQIPLTWEAAVALGQKILFAWQSYNTLVYLKYQDKLFPEMQCNLFEPDATKEKPKKATKSAPAATKEKEPEAKAEGKAEAAADLTDTFLVVGKVESGEMKDGNYYYKVAVQSTTTNETGDLVFYPNQTKKVEERFEKCLRWLGENPVGKCKLPIIYSVGAKGGYIFKNFAS